MFLIILMLLLSMIFIVVSSIIDITTIIVWWIDVAMGIRIHLRSQWFTRALSVSMSVVVESLCHWMSVDVVLDRSMNDAAALL